MALNDTSYFLADIGFCTKSSTLIDPKAEDFSLLLNSNADMSKALIVGFICLILLMNSNPVIPGILISGRTSKIVVV
jgi:hypothetical protein